MLVFSKWSEFILLSLFFNTVSVAIDAAISPPLPKFSDVGVAIQEGTGEPRENSLVGTFVEKSGHVTRCNGRAGLIAHCVHKSSIFEFRMRNDDMRKNLQCI